MVHPPVTSGIETLIAQVQGRPLAMLNLARTLLLPKGFTERARRLCEEALALAPDDPEVRAHSYHVRSHNVHSWYYTMVQDEVRHHLYAEAFRRLLKPGCTVLDIGAGTGLFAMLAAREGAGKVIACERDPAVASAAREIVELNGLSDRVTVVAKDALDLQIGVDLPERADVLLWDNLANNLFGAGALPTIEDARRRLLVDNALVIPGRAEVVVALVEDLKPQNRTMHWVDGFDMSPFNKLSSSNFTLEPSHFARASEPDTIFDVDFQGGEAIDASSATVTVVAKGGRVDGIAQWLRFHIGGEEIYDTGGGKSVFAFGAQFHAVEPFDAAPGQTVTVAGRHDRERTWFWVADR